VPAYDSDITHVTAKTKEWWHELFESEGWRVDSLMYTLMDVKKIGGNGRKVTVFISHRQRTLCSPIKIC